MNYLPVNVYDIRSNKRWGDCTNGGVTVTHSDSLVVPCPDGHIKQAEVDSGRYIVLEPIAPAFKGCPPRFKPAGIGQSSAGGNFVYTSDSRFSRQYGSQPVSVHDRVER